MKPNVEAANEFWHGVVNNDLVMWQGIIDTVRAARPLTKDEATADLRVLARCGPLPSRYELAKRWGWQGEAGESRARRLTEKLLLTGAVTFAGGPGPAL